MPENTCLWLSLGQCSCPHCPEQGRREAGWCSSRLASAPRRQGGGGLPPHPPPTRQYKYVVTSSDVDPHHLYANSDADPDTTYHPDADPDSDF